MKEELFSLLDKDFETAVDKLYEHGLGEDPIIRELLLQYSDPNSKLSPREIREKIRVFVRVHFSDSHSSPQQSHSWFISKNLISQDFLAQKQELNDYQINKKVCCAVIQIEPDCGIEYFIMHRHPDASLKSRKANAISIATKESIDQDILRAIAQLLGVTPPNNYTYEKLKISLAYNLLNMLKGKPVVLVIYNIELWGQHAWDHMTQIAKYFCEIPLDEVEHNLYCYFIHAEPNDLVQSDDDILILPPVCPLTENELQSLLATHYESFSHCYDQVKLLFTGEKYLSQVIDIFTTHSSYATELNAYFDQRLNFE